MKFVIDEVDINFERMELSSCYNWRYRGRMRPRFYFVVDKFISMSLIAKLKFNNDFLAMLKDKCAEAIEQMSDEDFYTIQENIRSTLEGRSHFKYNKNKMELLYGNTTKDRFGITRIYFEDSLANFIEVPETRQDLITALINISAKEIRKE